MPTYCTAADFDSVMSDKKQAELTDDAAGTTTDDTILDYYLDAAESMVDSYLCQQYTTPLDASDITPVLKHAILTIAKANLYLRRVDTLPDDVKQSYDEARAYLEKVAKGSVCPLISGGSGGELFSAEYGEDLPKFGTDFNDDEEYDRNVLL